MVPNEDPQRPGYPTWASNREPNASPCERILSAMVRLSEEQLERVAEYAERLAGWERERSDPRSLAARESAPPIHAFPDRCVCENGNWPDGAECPCDCHGPVTP